MSSIAKYAAAWSLTLAPVLLFVPAVSLARMGPCSFAHPSVMVIAFFLFAALEIAALPQFVRAARSVGRATIAIVGMATALFLFVLNAILEYYFVAEYWV